MNRISVKLRITLWLTALMLTLAALLMGFMLFISSSVATQTAMQELSQTVQNNLQQVSYTGGALSMGDGFSYYHSGVTTLIYSKSETLLAGQIPVAFTGASEPFQNGVTRTVSVGEQDYLVMDLWLASGWEDGVWIRGGDGRPGHGADREESYHRGADRPARLPGAGGSGELYHRAEIL